MNQRPQNTITRHSKNRVIYTIGHSNVSGERLLERLREYGVDRVIDVRTRPYSRWCPWFNKDQLEYTLAAADINYDWRGRQLGGLSENVDYDKTIAWVCAQAVCENIVLMCSEANYLKCHRYTMLTPDIERHGAEVLHISYSF